jgi:hypothetical protein
VHVAHIDGNTETPCAFQHGVGQPGGLGVPQGLAVPANKFVCTGGGFVGVAVLHALDHHPHVCFSISPKGTTSTTQITFSDVTFGNALHGHAGVQWVTERTPSDERIQITFSALDHILGQNSHKVGSGWTGFEFPTPELVGKHANLVARIVHTGQARGYCFEADTRDVTP